MENHRSGKTDKLADALGSNRPQVREILEMARRFHGDGRFERLLANQCLIEDIDISNLPPFMRPPLIPTNGTPLADILYGERSVGTLRLSPKDMFPLFGVFGASRSGKTMAMIYGVVVPLIEGNRSMSGTVFDPEGQYKEHLLPKYSDRVLVLKPATLMMNPITAPAALTPGEWSNRFASLWRSLNSGDAMTNMLVGALEYVHANHSTPTWPHLKERIKSLSFKPTDRAHQHRESLIARIDWLDSIFGKAWDCAQGFRREEMVGKWKILETVGLDLAMANFWQDLIIEREKYSCTSFSDEPREVLIFEEAHFRFGQDFMLKHTEVGERVALSHLRTLGKYGYIQIVVDQAPGLLAPQLIANLSGVLCFRLSNTRCVQTVSNFLGLDPEQRETLQALQNRTAVFFSHHSLPSPTLVRILDFRIHRGSPEGVESAIRQGLSELHFVSRELEPVVEKAKNETPKLTILHTDVLRSFATKWFVSLEQRQEECGNIHPEYFGRIVRELQSMDLLGELGNFSSGRGKPGKTAFVTEKGAQMLGIPHEKCVPKGRGSASVQHRYLQHILQQSLGNAVVEFQDADVVEYRPEGSLAYEIEMEVSEHIIRNIERDLATFGKVVVVARYPDVGKIKGIIEKALGAGIFDRVEVKTVQAAIKHAEV